MSRFGSSGEERSKGSECEEGDGELADESYSSDEKQEQDDEEKKEGESDLEEFDLPSGAEEWLDGDDDDATDGKDGDVSEDSDDDDDDDGSEDSDDAKKLSVGEKTDK